MEERKPQYCTQCNLRIASYADKSRDGTMHAHCARTNRHSQIPLSARFSTMSEQQLNEWRREQARG